MMEEVIMQGDQYEKPLKILINKEEVPCEQIDDIEVVISNCTKSMRKGHLYYSTELQAWLLQLSQEDTFAMHEGKQTFQVRVKLLNGEVIGRVLPDIKIVRSRSKEVL